MARRRLGKSDLRELNQGLQRFSLALSKSDNAELVDDNGVRVYVVNGEPWFFERQGVLVPHLRLLLRRPSIVKRVTVDMGAVRFLVNGADVMRPGVVAVEEGIVVGDFVVVVDEQHGKALVVGEALFDTAGMLAATGGKVVRALHYIGDRLWNQTM